MFSPRPLLLPVTLALLLSAGCHVQTHENHDGKDNVDIGTPFGSVHVKTDDKPGGSATGMTPYPGATVVKKDKDDDSNADVSLNFGALKLGVHTSDLHTSDPMDKVVAFYKNDMARYGQVLTCKGKDAVGTPVRTDQGLTCATNRNHVHTSEDNNLELRAGSEQHQHIVGIHPEDGGTHIGLVALDLPAGLIRHSDIDRE